MSQNVKLPSLWELFPELYGGHTRQSQEQLGRQSSSQQAAPAATLLAQQQTDSCGQSRSTSTPIPPLQTRAPLQRSGTADDRRYPCEVCGRRFSRPSARDTHMNTHTGERPHACTFPGCGKCFSARSNMQRHMRTHEGQDVPAGFVQPVQYTRTDATHAGRRV